jgi:predicted transcriptional regulator YheO
VAALAINLDLSEFDKANELLNEISKTNGEIHQKKTQTEQHESQGDDMATLIRGIIEDAIYGMQKPIHLAEKEDKIKAVKTMYERGLFLMKGSVTHVAMALNVSRFTIYNYLKELGYSE